MRPALQRLLARPTSLDFLRFLSEAPQAYYPGRPRRSKTSCLGCIRHYSRTTSTAQPLSYDLDHNEDSVQPAPFNQPLEARTKIAGGIQHISNVPHASWPNISVAETAEKLGYWNETLFTPGQIEFESDLEGPSQVPRLVDHPALSSNMDLWLCLMEYRYRRHGQAGVMVFWKAIRSRGVWMPCGRSADELWVAILDLGLKDRSILEDIYQYATELYESTGRSWPKLYVSIMQHFLLNGNAAEIVKWHDRLIDHHPPSSASFLRLAVDIFQDQGNLEGFRKLYVRLKHRNLYPEVIPILLSRQDFQAAFQWHFFLLNHGDLPPNAKMVEPLINYLAIYNSRQAVKVTKSLVESGVLFGTNGPSPMKKNTKISREMMNVMHGEAFNIGAKKYNDSLGARWFATTWIPLDIAINATQAFGVEVIGPLTLQALALREPDPKQVAQRIDQLKELGISIGNSVFSKALAVFARKNDALNLRLLLESDQHPDALEDWKLQEALIASYARNEDWVKFRHTIAVRALLGASPEIEEYNLLLRSHITNGDKAAVVLTLEDMSTKAIPAKPMTIRYIIRNVLSSRRSGQGIVATTANVKELNLAISILKQLMDFNCFVPVTTWKEIIRRLGMMGRLDDLDRLCIWLAAWYNPESSHRLQLSSTYSHRLPDKGRIPSQVPASHPLHPLRILFPDSLQKAIVEWGFIHAGLKNELSPSGSQSLVSESSSIKPSYTRGILLLHHLQRQNVAINISCVKRAIYNRLVILYGSGRSRRRRNEMIASRNVLPLREMIKGIDEAWGSEVFGTWESLENQIMTGSKLEEPEVIHDSVVRKCVAPDKGRG